MDPRSVQEPHSLKTGAIYPGFRHRKNCERPQLEIDPSTDKAVKNCNQLLDKKGECTLKKKKQSSQDK